MSRSIRPSPALTDLDKRILLILSEIILENLDGSLENRASEDFVVSDAQAEELLALLDKLIESEAFLRKLSFVNLIVDSTPEDPTLDLKLVRLTGKRPFGAGIRMSRENMRKRRVRLGVAPKKQPNDPSPMTFTHFIKMEEKLLKELNVNPRVAALVLGVAARSEEALRKLLLAINEDVDHARSWKVLRLDEVRRKLMSVLSDDHLREIPKGRIVGFFIFLSNASVLFTTRDWGVAGTMSTMCGGLSMMGDGRE